MKPALALLALLALALAANTSHAQATTAEAQAFFDAYSQTMQHGISQLHLAYAQVAAGLATLFLLLNMRSVAFLFLIGYAVAILNTPYYVPTDFKYFFGIAIIIMSIIGLLSRLLLLKKPAPKKTP
jgi:hypothetical protein